MKTAAHLRAGTCNHVSTRLCLQSTRRRPSPPVSATGHPAVGQDATAAYQSLCALIRTHGGFVHPALHIDAVSGGVIATHDIQQRKGSLVELPLSLRLTTAAAQEILLPALNAAGLPTISLLDEDHQLALAVAWLRNQGADTDCKWLTYVHSMSHHNPCGWAKSPQELVADHGNYLNQHGLDISWWRYFVAQVQQQMQESAEKLAARFGKALVLTAADMLWALGQVQARKVVIDNEALLEPWSDLLRHPSSQLTSHSRCEMQWTYGLCQHATSVVSRGAGKRITVTQLSSSTSTSKAQAAQTFASSNDTVEGVSSAGTRAAQEGLQPLLAAGEELWASSSVSSSSSTDDLWGAQMEQQGHLAPLAWYLQHGHVPDGLAGINMRTSDILESWRRTVASEVAGKNSAAAAASSGVSNSIIQATVLWDYLTQQYQQDALAVLAATPAEQKQQLLQFLVQPVTAESAPAEVSAAGEATAMTADVDPLPLIEALDELLIAAIDAAEAAGVE